MTSYLTQTMAREQVATLIAQAAQHRVRREFRQARRAERAARRDRSRARRAPANGSLALPHRIGLVGLR